MKLKHGIFLKGSDGLANVVLMDFKRYLLIYVSILNKLFEGWGCILLSLNYLLVVFVSKEH